MPAAFVLAAGQPCEVPPEREFFLDNLLFQIHYIIVMVMSTGLAPCEFEFPFPGSLTPSFLELIIFVNNLVCVPHAAGFR